jgi:hypothetical protein
MLKTPEDRARWNARRRLALQRSAVNNGKGPVRGPFLIGGLQELLESPLQAKIGAARDALTTVAQRLVH